MRMFHIINGQWVQVASDLIGSVAWDKLGVVVSISGTGDRFLTTAPGNDDNGNGSGIAQVFRLQMQPSAMPSISPTVTTAPSLSPSVEPSVSPTLVPSSSPTEECADSSLLALVGEDNEATACELVSSDPRKFCKVKKILTHCPRACGVCDIFGLSDSTATFIYKGYKKRTCKRVRGKRALAAKKLCDNDGIRNTCRFTCSLFCKKDE